ncbi:Clp protease N-terminal domain-containing protein [Pseudomonas aeruginosa]
MTISPRVKSALRHAFALSRELGHSYVGPEHLLLGLAALVYRTASPGRS